MHNILKTYKNKSTFLRNYLFGSKQQKKHNRNYVDDILSWMEWYQVRKDA